MAKAFWTKRWASYERTSINEGLAYWYDSLRVRVHIGFCDEEESKKEDIARFSNLEDENVEFAIDHIKRNFPDPPNDLASPSPLVRRVRRPATIGANVRVLQYHGALQSDSVAFGGNDTDLAGKFEFVNGLSSLAWTATYDYLPEPFYVNLTADFGYCNTSIKTNTDVGIYTYANGTTTNSTHFARIAEDVKSLENSNNYSDTTAMNDHLVLQATLLLGEVNRAMERIPRFCDAANQSTLVPDEAMSPPPNDTQKVQYLKDELRRKLFMYGQPGATDEELNAAELGQAYHGPDPTVQLGPTVTETNTETATATATATRNPNPLGIGPTRRGYNLFVAVGAPSSIVVGAAGSFVNSLAWKSGNVHAVDWSSVTGGAIGLFFGFILTAVLLGRLLAFGTLNAPADTAAAIVSNPADTIVRPAVRSTARAGRTVVGTSRENLMGLAIISNLRRGVREQDTQLAELEEIASHGGLSGRPSDDPLGVLDLRQGGFSSMGLPIAGPSNSQDVAGPSNSQDVAGPSNSQDVAGTSSDNGVCDIEQRAAAIVAGLARLQGPHAFTHEEAVAEGLTDETGLLPVAEEEAVIRPEQNRDNGGNCHYEE
ncbi:MAG: hypothetical protein OHK93_008656 [Ramalina farinacea]|uniref:Uncharacterized protein n=1 Tax=Ramalina farinacea TaxID=258253 RepID=A0AA43TVA9_9LECA|nr:hypothetical protein [Ramalina farinacea]